MKHSQTPSIEGVVLDYHKRLIPDNKASDCVNLYFQDKRVYTRYGYDTIGGNLPLNGMITGLINYELLQSTNNYLIAFTRTDAYKYDASSGNWLYITQRYIAGQAACAGSTTAVTGNTTVWGGLTHYDTYAQIKFGTQDPNGTGTPDTWYTVASFDSNTGLTLTANGPNTGGDVNYVIRLCYTGDDETFFSFAFPIDPVTSERLLVATNGIDPPCKYSGSNYFEDLGGSPPSQAQFLSLYYDHTVLANYYDTTVHYPRSLWFSDVADPEAWTTGAAGVLELAQSNDEIVGLCVLHSRLYVYKKYSISELYYTGNTDAPFQIDEEKIQKGAVNGKVIVNIGDVHIFLSYDGVYMFDGTSIRPIGGDIIDYVTSNINMDAINNCFAFNIEEMSLYCLAIATSAYDYPDTFLCYNYSENHWTIWKFDYDGSNVSTLMTCQGFYQTDSSQSWQDLITAGINTAWEDWPGRWSDSTLGVGSPIVIFGDSAGYVYKFQSSYTDDDGTDIYTKLSTRDYAFDDVKTAKKLYESILGLGVALAGTIRIRCSTDFGVSWTGWNTITLLGTGDDYEEYVVNWMNRGKQVRFEIENVNGTAWILESLLLGYEPTGLTLHR